MTEETKTEEVVTQPQEQVTTPELSEVEKRAMEMGWRPKSEFNGDDADFIDAKEFVGRKPLFDKIAHQSQEIKTIRRTLEALKNHYTKAQETEYNRALTKLQEAREEAISNADGVAFSRLDREIKDVEKQMAEVQQVHAEPEPATLNPQFVAWEQRNPWYTRNTAMRAWADEYGTNLHARGKSPEEVLRLVEKGVREEFPDKFVNQNKSSAPSVENSRHSSGRKSDDNFQLTDQQKRIMRDFVKTGVMTEAEYIASIKKMQ